MDEDRLDAQEVAGPGEGTGDERGPVATQEETAEAGAAWAAVLEHLDDLGEAIGRWAKAAVNDPENRRRAEELKEHVDRMGDRIGDAIDGASDTQFGQQVKDAADKAGEAIKGLGERIGDEVFPRMASAFEGAARKLHEAAEGMEAKAPEEKDPGEDVIL